MPTSNQRLRVSWCSGCAIVALIIGPAVALSLPAEPTPWSWLEWLPLAFVIGPPSVAAGAFAALMLPLAADAWGHLGWWRWSARVVGSGALAGSILYSSLAVLSVTQPRVQVDITSLLQAPLGGAALGAVGGLCVTILCPWARRSQKRRLTSA